jgi:hypothetical protein
MSKHYAFIAAALIACAVAVPMASHAADTKAPPNTPTAAEQPFVTKATADLQRLYGTTALAAKAGFFRYNNEDKTGAISWVNTSNWTSDETHPSQLWYDVKGNLIGVDYSQPWTDAKHPPNMWGILPARWFEFEAHTHYALKAADGSLVYHGMENSDITKAGGDPDKPTAEDLVRAGKAKSVGDVAFVFAFRHVWDLEFWVVPNPKGVFSEDNPNVKPSQPMSGSGM